MAADQRPPNPSSPHEAAPSTTFVHVDTKTFREVVQRLTGPSESPDPGRTVLASSPHASPATHQPRANVGVKKPAFKLHERRQYRGKLEILKPPPSSLKQQCYRKFVPSSSSPPPERRRRQQHRPAVSPRSRTSSPLGTPTGCLASLSLVEKESGRGESTSPPPRDLIVDAGEEERGVQARRFCLHPSPGTSSESSSAGLARPELLILFPLASPTAPSKES